MTHELLIGVASIIALGIGATWLAWRIHVPSILVLLTVGFIAGPVSGFLDPDHLLGDLLFPIVSISVAIILFEGGLSLRKDELGKTGGVVSALVTVGALLTWILIGLAAYLVLGFPAPMAALLGAILVVTGPTVIVPLLRHVQPTPRLASTLRWEGILIDPIGAVLAVLVFEAILATGFRELTGTALVGLVEALAIGIVFSILGALILVLLLKYDWAPDYLQSPLTLAVVVAAFALSNVLQPESGLITATLMGVWLTNQKWVDLRHIIEFKENLGVLLISVLFILLAARLDFADVSAIGIRHVLFLALIILLVRPLVVWICTLRSELDWRERAFVAWMAPRGIVAAAVSSVFALELANAGFTDSRSLVAVTFLVIIGTVVIYGLTALPVARLFGVANPNPQGVLIVGGHRWAREIARELMDEGVPVRLLDSNYTNIAAARMAGIPTYYGNALSETAVDDIDLTGIGRLIALTANNEVNSLAALHFSEVFGDRQVYQLTPGEQHRSANDEVPAHLRGRFLFDPQATYANLASRFSRGADIKTTNLTPEFDLDAFRRAYPDAIPLFIFDGDENVAIYTVDDPPAARPGQRVMAIVNQEKSQDAADRHPSVARV